MMLSAVLSVLTWVTAHVDPMNYCVTPECYATAQLLITAGDDPRKSPDAAYLWCSMYALDEDDCQDFIILGELEAAKAKLRQRRGM